MNGQSCQSEGTGLLDNVPFALYHRENTVVFISNLMQYFNSKTVSSIVDVSLRQIQYWDEQGFIRPTIRQATGRGSKRLYSFSDLVQLKVVKNLSDHGLSLQGIRLCLPHLRDYYRSGSQPTPSLKFLTDGKKLFVLTDDSKKILGALDHQFVFSLAIGSLVRELDGEVQRLEMKEKRMVLSRRRG